MISIKNGQFYVPKDEREIGFNGDNAHKKVEFIVSDSTQGEWFYRIYLQFDDNTVNFFIPDSTKTDGGTKIIWNISQEHIFKSGVVRLQIKAFNSNNDEVYHTEITHLIVGESIEFSDCFTEKQNAEFLQHEKNLNEILKQLVTAQNRLPYIGSNSNWFVYDSTKGQYVDSGVSASGKTELADGSVTTAKLADKAVTNDKIADGVITPDKISSTAVTTSKLGNGAVTTAKIANGAVTIDKLSEALISKLNEDFIVDTDLSDLSEINDTFSYVNFNVTYDSHHLYRINPTYILYDDLGLDISGVDTDELECYLLGTKDQQIMFIPCVHRLFIRRTGSNFSFGDWAEYYFDIGNGSVTTDKLSAEVTDKIDSNTADITQLKTDVLDNAEAITQNTADIEELKAMGLPSVNLTIYQGNSAIPDFAFCANTSLVSVTMPSDVKTIGKSAFQNCSNLTSVTMSKVTNIGTGAFAHCTSLESITIPDSVTTIGDFVFNTCTSLTSVTISNALTAICWGAFAHCKSLERINIPKSVISIGLLAFTDCPNLENVTLEDGFNANGLDLSASTKYTADTIVSWLNALADRTEQEQYTLKIGATNKAKLTEEQLAIATNKNWNIA